MAVASAVDQTFQAVNAAYANMHGYSVEDLIGAPVSTLWSSETRALMERHSARIEQDGRIALEAVHVANDGRHFPIEIIASTIKDSSGTVQYVVANVQDITERKKLQSSRLRAIELEAENRRIEEANRLKSEFLANMSHEVAPSGGRVSIRITPEAGDAFRLEVEDNGIGVSSENVPRRSVFFATLPCRPGGEGRELAAAP